MIISLKLYSLAGCPYCMRVKAHLKRLGLPYEEIKVPRLRSFRRQVYEISGQYKVPVLVDGDTVIVDSAVICTYLSDRYGKPQSDSAAASSVQF